MVELKHKFRLKFIIRDFTEETLNELSINTIAFTLPTISFSVLALTPAWSDISVTMQKDSSHLVENGINELLKRQMAKANYKFDLHCDILSDGRKPKVLTHWVFEGCFLKTIDYGELDYKSSEPTQFDLDICFDTAINYNTSK
jgi:hypothetical protein